MWVKLVIRLFISIPGKDKMGWGFGGTGKKSFASQFEDYGEVRGHCGQSQVPKGRATHFSSIPLFSVYSGIYPWTVKQMTISKVPRYFA